MTQQKRNPNPFIRMAQEAKAKKDAEFPHAVDAKTPKSSVKKSQTTWGATVVRRSGRGG